MWCFVRPPKYHWQHLATMNPPQYHCTTAHASAVSRCWLVTPSLRRRDCKGRVKPGMAAGCLFLLLVLYTENAASAVTRKPSDPVRLLIISSLCTLRGNVHFFPMYSSWECSFLSNVLCMGMFISSPCTLRGNVHFFPMYPAWECSFLPYVFCVRNVISSQCSLRWEW